MFLLFTASCGMAGNKLSLFSAENDYFMYFEFYSSFIGSHLIYYSVPPAGFEPATNCLRGSYSTVESWGRIPSASRSYGQLTLSNLSGLPPVYPIAENIVITIAYAP